MSIVPGRPLVVIAGWLGCQPRSLRRYKELYQTLGFSVLSFIAPPTMVVKASTQQNVLPFCDWKNVQRQANICKSSPETMQELAWNVLRDIHVSQCSVAMFHVFSNGGGFLWEQIQYILNTNETDKELQAIRSKIVGVVLDSAPAKYSPKFGRNTLYDALSHCTWKERMGTYYQVAKLTATLSLEEREKRANDYFESMRNDPWTVRQLYLFSKDDSLTPYDPLRELVRHRQELVGKDRIQFCEWESSPHCCHLLYHPVEYQAAVASFVDTCLYGHSRPLQSKL